MSALPNRQGSVSIICALEFRPSLGEGLVSSLNLDLDSSLSQ